MSQTLSTSSVRLGSWLRTMIVVEIHLQVVFPVWKPMISRRWNFTSLPSAIMDTLFYQQLTLGVYFTYG